MKVTVDLPEVEGFEYTGEYRQAKQGEFVLDGTCVCQETRPYTCFTYFIMKPVEPPTKSLEKGWLTYSGVNAWRWFKDKPRFSTNVRCWKEDNTLISSGYEIYPDLILDWNAPAMTDSHKMIFKV